MDDLKSIWNQIYSDPSQQEKIKKKQLEALLNNINNEQGLRTKFIPLLAFLIVLFAFGFTYIVRITEPSITIAKAIGIGLVILSGIAIALFTTIVKIPLQLHEQDKSSAIYLKAVKDKMNTSRKLFISGLIFQFLFLTSGLYLLIFYNDDSIHIGYLCTFFGIMLGLGGVSIGKGIAFINTYNSPTYKLIDHFLEE